MEYPEKDLTEKIIGAAIAVHKYWGPGLIESVYEKSLARELELQGIEHQRQVDLKLEYKGEEVGDGLRLDLIVEGKVIVIRVLWQDSFHKRFRSALDPNIYGRLSPRR